MDKVFALAVIAGLAWWTGEFAERRGQIRWQWVVASLILPLFSLIALQICTHHSFQNGSLGGLKDQLSWWKIPKPSRRALKQARLLESEYKQILRKNQRVISGFKSQLKKAEDIRGKRLGRVLGLEIHELWISTPVWKGPIDGIEATVVDESQVVQRLTLTRFAVAGPLSIFAPKRKTFGDVRLIIKGVQFNYAMAISANDKTTAQRKAYRLSNLINNAAIKAPELRGQRSATAKDLVPLANQSVVDDEALRRLENLKKFVESLPKDSRDFVNSRLSIPGYTETEKGLSSQPKIQNVLPPPTR